MSALPKLTPEAYLELERRSELKHEYIAGEIFAMSGGSPAHNLIAVNIGAALHAQFKRRPCRVYSSDQRVQVLDGYVYPDVTLVCGTPDFAGGDTLRNPTLIVEVLSPTTADYDLGGKFARYRQIPSLCDYLAVAQDRIEVLHYRRQDERHWLLTELTDPAAILELPNLDCRLALAEIYDKVFADPPAVSAPLP